MSYLNESFALLKKDIKCELRTRFAANAIFLFAFTTLIVISYSIAPYRIDEPHRPFIYATLLWIILVFSAFSGLSRSFVKEAEAYTEDLLRLSTQPEVVYTGKMLFNTTLLLLLELLIVPVFLLLMNIRVGHAHYLILLLLFGGVGLSATTTMVAAMIARARVKGVLFSALSFPLTFPLLITLIKGTEKSFMEADIVHWDEVRVAVAYIIVIGVLSLFLFPIIWRD
ncbi:heme exporter protein CcmB [candidate division KSB1 bacterium]|nr:heme exporter protein CcmB [candidate division KSB1 bacterium]